MSSAQHLWRLNKQNNIHRCERTRLKNNILKKEKKIFPLFFFLEPSD